jgi:hypothetical protein
LVVRGEGPAPDDYWFWTGAISGDGYGRFWIKRDGGQQAVRPQRYAWELVTGTALPSSTLLHSRDIPICVHADIDLDVSHVAPGTPRQNMLDRSQRGRYRNRATLRLGDLPRQVRVQRSLDLRAVILSTGCNRNLSAPRCLVWG